MSLTPERENPSEVEKSAVDAAMTPGQVPVPADRGAAAVVGVTDGGGATPGAEADAGAEVDAAAAATTGSETGGDAHAVVDVGRGDADATALAADGGGATPGKGAGAGAEADAAADAATDSETDTDTDGDAETDADAANRAISADAASIAARRAAAMAERPPRRIRHGLKLRGREEPKVESEVARRWLDRISGGVTDAEEANEGLKYARAGQTTLLEIEAGGVSARVQGHRGAPYRVRIPVAAWPMKVRDDVVSAMAGEAASLAALLDRRLPEGLDEMLAALDLELIPSELASLCECECTRPRICRHVLAVGMLMAERIQEDPVIALMMRDLPAERLLDRLRQQRALESRGLVTAHPEPDVPEAREEPKTLAESASSFWRPGARRTELAAGLPRDEQDHALLRRLGSSPLGGQFPLVGLLASIYDAVREEVRRGEAEAEAWAGAQLEDDAEVEDDLIVEGKPVSLADDGGAEVEPDVAPPAETPDSGDTSSDEAPVAPTVRARSIQKAQAIGKAKARAKPRKPAPTESDDEA